MKVLSLIILQFILLSPCLAQSKKQVRNYGITLALEEKIAFEDGKETQRYLKEKRTWNKKGELTLEEHYSKNGELESRESFNWEKGRLMEEMSEKQDKKGSGKSEFYRKTYTYEKKNKVEEKEFKKTGELTKRTVFTYNRFGDKIQELEYSDQGVLVKTTTYTYNKKGLRTEKAETNAKGELTEKTMYKYSY
ncbi:MAG: hypothetical protein WED33_03460 [Bacteroidia bacterium]